MNTINCSKCKSEMEKGLVADKGHFWSPVKPTWGTGISKFMARIENQRNVVTYRCKSCGFLESFAE